MWRFCQRPGRNAGASRVGRAIVGWFFLVLAVTVTQAVTGMSPVAARGTPLPSDAASDTLLTWGGGGDDDGELGDGTTTSRSTPATVNLPPDTKITAIAAGDNHSLALTSTGTVLAWGNNNDGKLGDGTTTSRSTPATVSLPPDTKITAIATTSDHNLALTSTGTVLAWGENNDKKLGDGTFTSRSTPVTVNLPPDTKVTAIAAGFDHSLALTSTGTVVAWGENYGKLGDGTTSSRTAPVTVNLPPDTKITAIAAGDNHSLALTSTGTVLAWGSNSEGQVGDGTTSYKRSAPVNVDLPPGTTITAITGGRSHSLAVTSTGTALAWGENVSGQLGDGTTANRSTPGTVNLPPGTTITAVAAGDAHSLALTAPPPVSTTTLQVTPPNPAADQDITLTATVTCNVDTPTGTITFRTNTTTLATTPLTTATATHTTTLPPGTHTITAHYTSTNTCPNDQSTPVSLTVAPPPEKPDEPVEPEHETDEPEHETDEPGLPITGPNLTTTIGAAALSILAGVILSYAARRRRPHRAT